MNTQVVAFTDRHPLSPSMNYLPRDAQRSTMGGFWPTSSESLNDDCLEESKGNLENFCGAPASQPAALILTDSCLLPPAVRGDG